MIHSVTSAVVRSPAIVACAIGTGGQHSGYVAQDGHTYCQLCGERLDD